MKDTSGKARTRTCTHMGHQRTGRGFALCATLALAGSGFACFATNLVPKFTLKQKRGYISILWLTVHKNQRVDQIKARILELRLSFSGGRRDARTWTMRSCSLWWTLAERQHWWGWDLNPGTWLVRVLEIWDPFPKRRKLDVQEPLWKLQWWDA